MAAKPQPSFPLSEYRVYIFFKFLAKVVSGVLTMSTSSGGWPWPQIQCSPNLGPDFQSLDLCDLSESKHLSLRNVMIVPCSYSAYSNPSCFGFLRLRSAAGDLHVADDMTGWSEVGTTLCQLDIISVEMWQERTSSAPVQPAVEGSGNSKRREPVNIQRFMLIFPTSTPR